MYNHEMYCIGSRISECMYSKLTPRLNPVENPFLMSNLNLNYISDKSELKSKIMN